ncbi:MAG: YihY/virulence factor BrkB family protein [Gemmatimonadetes bacterium]|nr:YihY/virulence factor BrkB family protein [Gemmatimonadota bacterium]
MTHAPSLRHRLGGFLHRLWEKTFEDDVFFMAGAVAFNIILAMIPLLVLGVGLTGFVLHAQVRDPVQAIVSLIQENLPQVAGSEGLTPIVQQITEGLLSQRTDLTVIGALVFVWLAMRLAGTVRVVLREIFDISQARGLIMGKLFDAQVVVVGVFFLTLNLGATISMEAAVKYGVRILGLGVPAVGLADQILGRSVAFASIWALFLVVYRYLPARRIPWRSSLVAATFSAVLHESIKWVTSWYFTSAADFTTTFGNLATVAVFILWIYYEAAVFIVGGEVAQVYTMRKAARVQVRATLQGEQ